jgi:hypothetical protein
MTIGSEGEIWAMVNGSFLERTSLVAVSKLSLNVALRQKQWHAQKPQ